jgi:hypothetical protein
MLDLVEILKNCPVGTKLYSILFGEVEFEGVHSGSCAVRYTTRTGRRFDVTREGKMFEDYDGECTLFPSKDQRDWYKFVVPQSKKERFNPETLKPFDKVIVRLDEQCIWCCDLFSFVEKYSNLVKGCGAYYKQCVPCNEETKHLIGTTNEAPIHYRYWEN